MQDDHVRSRVGQVRYLAELLVDWGIPIVQPVGGHAVFLDAKAFYPHLQQDQFPAQVLTAALYLDSGIDAVNSFMHPLLQEASEDILLNHKNEDPKSLLQEWAQSQGFQAPLYITRSAHGPDHSKIFELEVVIAGNIYGTGTGPSKSMAAKAAARVALLKLGLVEH